MSAHTLTAAQSVHVLTGLAGEGAARGLPALRNTAIGEINALINGGQITANQAVVAMVVAAGASGSFGPAAVGPEISSLIAHHQLTAAQVLADINSAVEGKALTAGQAAAIRAFVTQA